MKGLELKRARFEKIHLVYIIIKYFILNVSTELFLIYCARDSVFYIQMRGYISIREVELYNSVDLTI
jgi:hypothetical protein